MSGVADTLDILNDVIDIGTDMKDVADEEGTSDGAHKGWVTRRMGGTFEDQDELDKFKSKMVVMDDAGKKKLKDLEDRKEKQNKRDDVRNERHTTQVKVVDNLNDVDNWISDEELKTLVPELSDSREDTVYERNSLEQLVGDGKIEKKMIYADGYGSYGDVMYKAKDPNDSDEITAMKNHYGDMDYKLKYDTNFKDVRNKLDDGELRNFNRDEEGNYYDHNDWRKITWVDADNFLDNGTIRKIQVGALVQQMYERKVRERMQEERTPEEIEQGIDYLKKSNKRGYSWASKDDYSGIMGGAHLDAKGYDYPLDRYVLNDDKINAVLSEDEKNELSEIENFERFTSGFLTQNVEAVLQQMIGSGGKSPDDVYDLDSHNAYSEDQWKYEYGAKSVRFNKVEDESIFSKNALYLNRKATDEELSRRDRKLQDKRKNLPQVDLTQLPEW